MASPVLASEGNPPPPRVLTKDEIGYKFVKDYYTTLNQDPSRIHRYYKKQSTLTHGNEGGISDTYIGQRDINDMVESFGYRDCAVILSSVDCMESMNGGILIQVLGELSNDGGASQRFAQTFFLASVPPSGYFVLNNIFRFLKEDVDSDYDDVEPDSGNEMDASLSGTQHFDSVSAHLSNGFHHATSPIPVDQEEDLTSGPLAISVGPSFSTVEATTPDQLADNLEATPPDAPKHSIDVDPGFSQNHPTEEIGHSTEEPVDMEDASHLGTEASSEDQGQPSAASPVVPASPVVKTWATMAASSPEKWGDRGSDAKVVAAPPASRVKPAAVQSGPRKDSSKNTHSEKPEPALGYIKHVHNRVQKPALNDALVKFGPLRDLDINRQKSCGFVEFATHAALQAAIASSPMDIGDNYKIVVEERRKSSKSAEGKSVKQLVDRRIVAKSDAPGSKKTSRAASAQKSRAD